MPTNIKNWGRAWKLTVTGIPFNAQGEQQVIVAGTDAWTPEALRITFEVRQSLSPIGQIGGFWFADISIYNLNQRTTQIILQQGMTVKLEAGYQNKYGYGTIFEGTLFQPTWERVEGITEKLTLHCIVGLVENTNNFIAFNTAAGVNQKQIVSRMAATPNIAFNLDTSDVIFKNDITTTRGEVYFGQPFDYLQDMANQDTGNFWATNQAVHIRQLTTQTTDIPTLQYNQSNIIGTPQQTQDGVEIKVLLDARPSLREQFQLNNSQIRQQVRLQGSYPNILDASGIYNIIEITHVGDSRGNEWYTYLLGVNNAISRFGLESSE